MMSELKSQTLQKRQKRRLLTTAIPLLVANLVTVPAGAQELCAAVPVVFERFRMQHGELPAISMRDQRGMRLVVLANPVTGSWSLFVLDAPDGGVACLVAVGSDFMPDRVLQGRQS